MRAPTIAESTPRAKAPPPLYLTPRELELSRWLGEDATYEEIAKAMGIRRDTVRAHLRNLCEKLGVRTRHAVVARLARAGVQVFQGRDGGHDLGAWKDARHGVARVRPAGGRSGSQKPCKAGDESA